MLEGVVVLVLIFLWLIKFRLDCSGEEFNLILAGGLVNLVDRLRFGYVRDYWQWGRFYNNIADWVISVGVVCLLIKSYVRRNKNNL